MEIEFFLNPSKSHKVTSEPGGFSIEPVSEDAHDMDSFQPIAKQAKNYSGTDYEPIAHPKDVGPYDLVFFGKK